MPNFVLNRESGTIFNDVGRLRGICIKLSKDVFRNRVFKPRVKNGRTLV